MINFHGSVTGGSEIPQQTSITNPRQVECKPGQQATNDSFVQSNGMTVENPQNEDNILATAFAEMICIPFNILAIQADKTYKYTAQDKKPVLFDLIEADDSLKKNDIAIFMSQYYALTAREKTYEDKRYIQKLKTAQLSKMSKRMSEEEFTQKIADFYQVINNYPYKNESVKDIAQTIEVDFTNIMKKVK